VANSHGLFSKLSQGPASIVFHAETLFAGAEKLNFQGIIALNLTPTPDEADMNS